MGRLLMKIIVLPVSLFLRLLSGVFEISLRLYSFCAGIVYLFLFICLILAIASGQWMNVGILVGITAGAVFVTVLVGIAGATIEVLKDKTKSLVG